MADNYELFVKRRALIKRLRERNIPRALEKWSLFSEKHKIFRLKSEKALKVLNNNLKKKAFLCYKINCEERKDFRALYKKAYIFN